MKPGRIKIIGYSIEVTRDAFAAALKSARRTLRYPSTFDAMGQHNAVLYRGLLTMKYKHVVERDTAMRFARAANRREINARKMKNRRTRYGSK